MTTLFISDLHLDETRPEVTEAFLKFLRERASRADALYILGDLFEAWTGDDDDSALATTVANGLSAVSVPKFYMHGNRDFLLGSVYAHKCGMTILDDPTVIDLYGVPTLLSHGDIFCTDDVAYQQFRAQVRDPIWQQGFLAQPLEARRAFAAQARAASASHQAGLSNMEVITDVTPAAVNAAMASCGAPLLIHGHTHRPDRHLSESFERIVLGDWYEQGSVLVAERDGSLVLDSFGFAIPT